MTIHVTAVASSISIPNTVKTVLLAMPSFNFSARDIYRTAPLSIHNKSA
jgi:hypothetical protein